LNVAPDRTAPVRVSVLDPMKSLEHSHHRLPMYRAVT
jgi:hypothetical protein